MVLIFSISAFAVPNSIDFEQLDQDVTIVKSVDQNIDVVLNFEFVVQVNDAVDSKSDYIFKSKINGNDVLKAKTIFDITSQEAFKAKRNEKQENTLIDPGRNFENNLINRNFISKRSNSSSGGMPKTL